MDMPELRGEVIYLYAFDVAYELRRDAIHELLGQRVEQFEVEPHKRMPRQLFFHRPQMVRLPIAEHRGSLGAMRLSTTIKLLPVGAITITMRIPFAVDALADLVAYHAPQLDGISLDDHARRLAEQVCAELVPALVRPVASLAHEEAYTVFCLDAQLLGTADSKSWLDRQRREVTALLTQESDPAALADEEVEESTQRALSYYRTDLLVMDWDAALIVDRLPPSEETLYILELANLQLAELEAYDRLLDEAIERAYRDLGSRRLAHRVIGELGELRIDMARLNDELSNITKFFGDWHLARIYAGISLRFHLADWQRTIDDKLKTLDSIYQVLSHQPNNRLMLILESVVVALFVIDLALVALDIIRH